MGDEMEKERKKKLREVQVLCSKDFYRAVELVLMGEKWRGYCVSSLGQHLARTVAEVPAQRATDRGREAILCIRLNGYLHARLKSLAVARGCTMCEAMRRLLAVAAGLR